MDIINTIKYEFLERYKIPDTVTRIADHAFLNCRNLKHIILPQILTEIGDQTFYRCENLMEIRIPEKTSQIGRYAFLHCINLEKIVVDEKNAHFTCQDGMLYTRDARELVAKPYGKLFYRDDLTIDELELTLRSYHLLRRAGINTVGELLQKSGEDLLKIRCFGKSCLKNVECRLEEKLGVTLSAGKK